ncbi:cysteine desulfurase [Pseudomonas fulva]|uniref:cysteine desulfurase family protein n=1 Tax=Pseudomonas fulva TaxID=47880 RepID=UPI0018AB3AF9|nr:cysteine desulfurase family protein [Pseudomonas fulva]MBF8673880.1 cysteine desulfurase [Pseudomonas fulva]MBF8697495.1 cysteine desulfurase [Pseudomonas fulva]
MNNNRIIYLDAAATMPCAHDVITAMMSCSVSNYGNASSNHIMGRRAKIAIHEATRLLAKLINCSMSEITYTAGATESNNLVILGCAEPGSNIIISPIDHKSILASADELKTRSIEVRKMKVDSHGRIDINHLRHLIDSSTSLISLSYVNSEIGTYQNLANIRCAITNSKAILHVDASQALGRLPIDVRKYGIDCASFSAHKIGGPKGIGALYTSSRSMHRLRPITFGGAQSELRSGTLPTPLIVGFGVAAKLIAEKNLRAAWKSAMLRRRLILNILAQQGIHYQLNSPLTRSTPHILNLSIPGVRSETIINCLSNVCISSGSACNTHNLSPSHVITGIGHSKARAECALRISYASDIDIDELQVGAECIASTLKLLNNLTREHP